MKIKRLVTQEVDFITDPLVDGVIYVSRKFGLAIHLCACGCATQTVTPFSSPSGWQLSDGPNGITLRPSIGNQQFPCRSHYWITDGMIQPC